MKGVCTNSVGQAYGWATVVTWLATVDRQMTFCVRSVRAWRSHHMNMRGVDSRRSWTVCGGVSVFSQQLSPKKNKAGCLLTPQTMAQATGPERALLQGTTLTTAQKLLSLL